MLCDVALRDFLFDEPINNCDIHSIFDLGAWRAWEKTRKKNHDTFLEVID